MGAPFRPRDGARLAWPDGFGTRYTVFVDTEEEFDWAAPLDRDERTVGAMSAVPDAHRRFGEMGAALTYLVDHPIATDPQSVDILQAALRDGRSAVGTQLHPWVNPPFEEEVTGPNSFVGNLPRALEAAKIDALTGAITDAFGAPKVFRAGRYGLGPATLGLLAARGYRIDTSMRSQYDYSGEGGPDYTRIGNHAFRTAEGLVELPLTTIYTGALRGLGRALYPALGALPKGRGVASRSGLLSRIALTPEEMPLADAVEAVRIAVGEGVRVLNFAFHSPSLEPGHTPYVRDAGDLTEFYRWWDVVTALLGKLGVANASLDEMLAAADAAG